MRLIELDVLRGIAIISVVLYHFTSRYEELYQHSKPDYFLDFSLGYLGVQLFFIISGFVIIMTLERCKDIKDFIFKRAIRLYPAYIAGVCITFALVGIFGLEGRETSLPVAIFNLTMLHGLIPSFPHVDGVYWSLTVELIFYAAMGALFVIGQVKKIEKSLVIWLILSFLVATLKMYSGHVLLSALQFYGILSHSHLFIAGIMFYKLKQKSTINTTVAHIMILFCLVFEFLYNSVVSGIAVSLFFIVFYLLVYEKLSIINNRPIAFLGTISFSLYLIHQNIGYIVLNFLEDRGLINEVYVLVPIAISIILASVMTFYIERPVQKYFRSRKDHKRQDQVLSNAS